MIAHITQKTGARRDASIKLLEDDINTYSSYIMKIYSGDLYNLVGCPA